MNFIEVKNVTKMFDNKAVLDNISLTVEEGEVLGILGRSGSGKSVLLNMLRGIPEYAPDEGEVIYHIAYCPECDYVDSPSKINERCKCGHKLESRDLNLWEASRTEFVTQYPKSEKISSIRFFAYPLSFVII